MKESRLKPAALGDGLGGAMGRGLILSFSLSFRSFLSLLLCLLFLSMTISMLSIVRKEIVQSIGSALAGVTGVGGGGGSWLVDAFTAELERERERVRVVSSEVEPGSINSPVKTRRELASSAVRN